MPRVALTAAQREANRVKSVRQRVSDGLAVHKNRKRATARDLAAEFGINKDTVCHILHEEEFCLPFAKVLAILDTAGLEVKAKREE